MEEHGDQETRVEFRGARIQETDENIGIVEVEEMSGEATA